MSDGVTAAVIDDPVTRYVKWFAAGCVLLGAANALGVAGSLIYVASSGVILEPAAALTLHTSWWLVDEAIRFWALLLLIGGWGILRGQPWSRTLLITWAIGNVVLMALYCGHVISAYLDSEYPWALEVRAWLHLPADIAGSIVVPAGVFLFLTRPGVVAATQRRGFDVMPLDRSPAA